MTRTRDLLLAGLLALGACATSAGPAPTDGAPTEGTAADGADAAQPIPVAEAARPARWAAPLEVAGLPNLHRLDDGLYRSAQPTAEGLRNARALGIRRVVNLRSFHSDRDELGDTDLEYEHLWVKAWHPELKEVVRFLQLAGDPARGPLLVHCQHGADRTGVMCAAYRVCVQGWTKREAVDEMTRGGYGFHGIWANLVGFVEELDVEDLRRRAGLEPRPDVPCAGSARVRGAAPGSSDPSEAASGGVS